MNFKKAFTFLGQFSLFCRNFQDLGCQSTIKARNDTDPPIHVLLSTEKRARTCIWSVVYYPKRFLRHIWTTAEWFLFAEQNGGPQRLSRPAVQSDYFPLIFKFTLLNKLLFQSLTIFVLLTRFLGHSRRVRKKVGNEFDIVRGKFVVLHNGRTDLRVILASWGPKKDHYGTR